MTIEEHPRYVYVCVIQMYACLITETQHGMWKD